VDHQRSAGLEPFHIGLRVPARSFDDRDPLPTMTSIRCRSPWAPGSAGSVRLTPNGRSVSARVARSPARAPRRFEGQGGQDAERTGVRDRGHQLGLGHPHHAALDDRVLDSQHPSHPRRKDPRLHSTLLPGKRSYLLRRVRSAPLGPRLATGRC
jgi:hypothetical protein